MGSSDRAIFVRRSVAGAEPVEVLKITSVSAVASSEGTFLFSPLDVLEDIRSATPEVAGTSIEWVSDDIDWWPGAGNVAEPEDEAEGAVFDFAGGPRAASTIALLDRIGRPGWVI